MVEEKDGERENSVFTFWEELEVQGNGERCADVGLTKG